MYIPSWRRTQHISYGNLPIGRVTYDLVNEVLKDCDVPPIVGANNEPWDKIEYDGVYFFNSDEVLDLREEYIKDVSMEQTHNVLDVRIGYSRGSDRTVQQHL